MLMRTLMDLDAKENLPELVALTSIFSVELPPNPSSWCSGGSRGGGEQFLQGDLEVVGQVPYVGYQFPA